MLIARLIAQNVLPSPASALVTSTRLAGTPALGLAAFDRLCRLMRRKPSAIGVRSPSGVILLCRRSRARSILRVRVVVTVERAGLASPARSLSPGKLGRWLILLVARS